MSAFISAITGNFKGFSFFTIIIIIHELGHISLALFYKWNIEKVILLPFGALTIFEEDINRPLMEEFLILIFGPIYQIIFTIILSYYNFDELLINYSKIILIFNLLPIYPLDGSKLINIILNKFLSFKKSHIITVYISFLTIIIILIKFDINFVLLLIISLIFVKVLEELKNHNNIFNRFLLERYTKKFKFKKYKVINSDKICKMKRDYRHIFYDGKKYITEREILRKRFDLNNKIW